MSRKIFVAAALALALCAGAAAAVAQTGLADKAIDAACANNGSALHWLVYILGGSVAASVLANFRNKLPPVVVTVLDALAINFVKTLQASADAAKKSAPALLVLVLAGGVLAGCAQDNPLAQAPTITLSANGTAAAAAPTQAPAGAGPLQQVATDIGNTFSKDDVAGINMACGTPVADPIGCAFLTDLANLANSLKVQGATATTAGVLSQVEQLRLGLMSVNALAQNQLLAKTLADGLIWVQDTKAKGLAVPGAVTGLLGDIAVLLAVPAL